MNRIQILLLCTLFYCFNVFSQEQQKNGYLALTIRNEMNEVFKGTILLIANKDTIPIAATWDYSFRANLLPGNYRLILKNKLFDDYLIDSIWIGENEIKELEIAWKHKTIRLPEVRFPLCSGF